MLSEVRVLLWEEGPPYFHLIYGIYPGAWVAEMGIFRGRNRGAIHVVGHDEEGRFYEPIMGWERFVND